MLSIKDLCGVADLAGDCLLERFGEEDRDEGYYPPYPRGDLAGLGIRFLALVVPEQYEKLQQEIRSCEDEKNLQAEKILREYKTSWNTEKANFPDWSDRGARKAFGEAEKPLKEKRKKEEAENRKLCEEAIDRLISVFVAEVFATKIEWPATLATSP